MPRVREEEVHKEMIWRKSFEGARSFEDILWDMLGLSEKIYRTCLRTGSAEYVLTGISLSPDLGNWVRGAEPYSGVGITLTVIGFLGSFVQGVMRSIFRMTLGRLGDWVRRG